MKRLVGFGAGALFAFIAVVFALGPLALGALMPSPSLVSSLAKPKPEQPQPQPEPEVAVPNFGTGNCSSASLTGYANGRIPASALCPLRYAQGHRLRSDAATAFDRMAQAYQAELGEKICVTDSYRSYAAQVSVKLRKPTLAAVPGTSNHGLGQALDMCGGIQNFGTREHRWMRANAPKYGWIHPSWARIGGSRPEAWHWEFGVRD